MNKITEYIIMFAVMLLCLALTTSYGMYLERTFEITGNWLGIGMVLMALLLGVVIIAPIEKYITKLANRKELRQ